NTKYGDIEIGDFFGSIVILNNDRNVIALDNDDRRFTIIEPKSTKKENHVYFGRLAALYEDHRFQEHFFNYLLHARELVKDFYDGEININKSYETKERTVLLKDCIDPIFQHLLARIGEAKENSCAEFKSSEFKSSEEYNSSKTIDWPSEEYWRENTNEPYEKVFVPSDILW